MTTASRPRQSLLDLFDPLSSSEKVPQQRGDADRSSPTPSTESGSDKENICAAMPKGTPKTVRGYDDNCLESSFFKRTASRVKAPEHPDSTRESFSIEGSDASNLCLVELGDELDKVCSLGDDSVQSSAARREPLTEIAIPQTNYQTPSNSSHVRKNLISFDTPKYTPKSRSLSLKFAAGISGCDGIPQAVSPTSSSIRSTPRQNLLSPSIVITTPVVRNTTPVHRSTSPPLRPPFSSPTSLDCKPCTPQACDSPRFQDPPSSLGRSAGDLSSASLDIRSVGKRLDFSNDLLKDEPSLLDKLDNDSFSSDFEFPKTAIERITPEPATLPFDDSDKVLQRSRSKFSTISSVSRRSRSKTPMARSAAVSDRISNSSEDEYAPRPEALLSRTSSLSSSGSCRSSSSNSRSGMSSRRSSISIYETDGINLLDESLDDRPSLRKGASSLRRRGSTIEGDLLTEPEEKLSRLTGSSVSPSHSRPSTIFQAGDSDGEERDDFDLKTYTAPKPVSGAEARLKPKVSVRPRISSIAEPNPLARSQSLSKRTSMIMPPPPPSSSLRASTLGRPSLSRRSSIGINLDRQSKAGFDISASQGREDAPKPKIATSSVKTAPCKRLSMSTSVSVASARESTIGTIGRSGLRSTKVAPPTAFNSSTLGRSTVGKANTMANPESRAPVLARSSAAHTLGRRSSIGLANSLSASTSTTTGRSSFRRTSSVSTLPPLSKDDVPAATRRTLARTSSVGTERAKSISGLSGLSSRLTATASKAVKKMPTTNEQRAI